MATFTHAKREFDKRKKLESQTGKHKEAAKTIEAPKVEAVEAATLAETIEAARGLEAWVPLVPSPLEALTNAVKEANAALLRADIDYNAALENEKTLRVAYESARVHKDKAERDLLAYARGEVT